MSKKDELIKLLLEENRLLKERIVVLEQCVSELKQYITVLESKLAQYIKRATSKSDTSSKPPSSDGLSKVKREPISSRECTKPFGGQKNHQGSTMDQVPFTDKIEFHKLEECQQCGLDLSAAPLGNVLKRQVRDIEIKTIVTEHQGEVKVCSCGKKNIANFPEGVEAPAQYGENIRAISTYLQQQFVPLSRLSEIMQEVFQVNLSETSLMNYEDKLTNNLRTFHAESREYLEACSFKNADETGIRSKGESSWIHVLCNRAVTFLLSSKARTCPAYEMRGTLMHDHFPSYRKHFGNIVHAFCNAHHLRELKSIVKYDNEAWGQKMIGLLRETCHSKNQGTLSRESMSKSWFDYDIIIQEALKYHDTLEPLRSGRKGKIKRRTGHNLALRLQTEKVGVLMFMTDPKVSFTNNQAERDLRMVKVKQKVSGCFRTDKGVENFAIIRSFISTLRKNQRNVLQGIREALKKPISLLEIIPELRPLALPPPP